MKGVLSAALVAVVAVISTPADAAKGAVPQIAVGINSDAPYGGVLGAVEPAFKWTSSTKAGEYDLEGGIDLTIQDVDVLPYSLWGTAKRKIQDWTLFARVDVSSSDLNTLDVDLQASRGSTSLQVKGSSNPADAAVSLRKVRFSQQLDGLGGSWSVTPTYNVNSKKPDVSVSYGFQDTVLTVDAERNMQKVTVSQQVGKDNTIIPSITSEGEMELGYQRALPENAGTLTATYKPKSHVGLSWGDGAWEAEMVAPMDGYYKFNRGKTTLKIRRTIDFES